MSAFLVTRDHISYLISAALSRTLNPGYGSGMAWTEGDDLRTMGCTDYDEASRVAQMLWDENMASIHNRYPDTEKKCAPSYGPHRRDIQRPILAVQVLKAIDCYEYQSCEHGGWEQSDAHSFTSNLRRRAIAVLPGYEEADWAIGGA